MAQTSTSALLASFALLALPATAQPEPAPASPTEREIAITGAPDEHPPMLYAAPNQPLMVTFDAPLRKDAAVAMPGADVRPHPFLPNAVLITPSKSLAAQGSVPVQVPLADGAITLTLTFSPARRDASVHLTRRPSSAPPAALTPGELQELLTLAACKAFEPEEACADAKATGLPRPRAQDGVLPEDLLVHSDGTFAYVRLTAGADCRPARARLTRGGESNEVLLLREVKEPKADTHWLVVARAPRSGGGLVTLDLLTEGGALCRTVPLVNLKP